ncbi:hypothetical protein CDL15_Pgr005480 [Punica granatum]|uniref:Uncharacterized protein n=1 Tax=Punica granatum TaxID=22663 RepID=A0A218WV95_PUNGR|nr:hypothetical protein CDL15_Pgr005480 [Punica granatum]
MEWESYKFVAGDDDDPSSAIGHSWKSTLFTNDKSIAEKRAAHLGMKLQWTEDCVKTIMGPILAIRFDNSRNCKIWFNSMVAPYTRWKDSRNDPEKAGKLGNS